MFGATCPAALHDAPVAALISCCCPVAAQIDQPGSAIDAYIEGLRDVLERKAANIAQLQGRLESFQVPACAHCAMGSCCSFLNLACTTTGWILRPCQPSNVPVAGAAAR